MAGAARCRKSEARNGGEGLRKATPDSSTALNVGGVLLPGRSHWEVLWTGDACAHPSPGEPHHRVLRGGGDPGEASVREVRSQIIGLTWVSVPWFLPHHPHTCRGATTGWTTLSLGGHEAHTLQGTSRSPGGQSPRRGPLQSRPQVVSTFLFSLCPPPSLLLRTSRKHPRTCPHLRLCFGRDGLDHQALPGAAGTAQQAARDAGTRNAPSPAHCGVV